jgi:hypothetical protein
MMMREIETSEEDGWDSAFIILTIATFAYRPLHLYELRVVAGLDDYHQVDLEGVVDRGGSFLIVGADNRIYLVHQSAKDYLVGPAAAATIFPMGQPYTIALSRGQ